MVSTVTRNVSGGSATPPLSPRSSGGSPGAATSNDTVRTATSSRVDSLLQQYIPEPKEYRDRLQSSSSLPGENQQRSLTPQHGQPGIAGVLNEVSIPFQLL